MVPTTSINSAPILSCIVVPRQQRLAMFGYEQNDPTEWPRVIAILLEIRMLDYSIMKPDGILVLKPGAPLSKEDFDGLSAAVDDYLSDHPKLHGY